jgi:TetR/AcrR family transcriptional repressor of nem operon
MARPREFDESVVIDKAMQQFWSHGYEATSVDDLCAATGLNRSSLYRAFGSKRELLDVALTAYERNSLQRIEQLFAKHPIHDALRLFLLGLFNDKSGKTSHWGCLIGNCTTELAARDPKARERLRLSMHRIEEILRTAVRRGQESGALTARTDPQSLAQFLLTQAQGLRLLAKTKPPRAVLENIVTTTLSVLD